MQSILSRLLITLVVATNFNTEAAPLKQKELNFKVKSEEYLKGDVAYALQIISRDKLRKKFPEFVELDTLNLLHEKNVSFLIKKTAFIVEKPVGFFDHEKTTNEQYLKHILDRQEVQKINEKTFKVIIPGAEPLSYKMRVHFDSDDISTTADSKSIKAVTAAKKMDVLVQGASSIMVKEMWDYSRGAVGGVEVIAYITIKENVTLVLSYGLMALIPPLVATETIDEQVKSEADGVRVLINTFKPE